MYIRRRLDVLFYTVWGEDVAMLASPLFLELTFFYLKASGFFDLVILRQVLLEILSKMRFKFCFLSRMFQNHFLGLNPSAITFCYSLY